MQVDTKMQISRPTKKPYRALFISKMSTEANSLLQLCELTSPRVGVAADIKLVASLSVAFLQSPAIAGDCYVYGRPME